MLLAGLDGANPLSFLASLGTIGAVHRAGRRATLQWSDELVSHPVLEGIAEREELLAILEADRSRWLASPVLRWPAEAPLPDAKPTPDELRAWAGQIYRSGDSCAAALFSALVAEGAYDRQGNAKPTHLHFTAGQQHFLTMVRDLGEGVDAGRLAEALFGPWRYGPELPSLSWDVRGERLYAVRATDPSKEKRSGVPGADWLAFTGLQAYPVRAGALGLETAACDRRWKISAFRWPLWSVPLTYPVLRSVLTDPTLVAENTAQRNLDPVRLRGLGVSTVFEAPLRRSAQGGYGSFGGPLRLAEAAR